MRRGKKGLQPGRETPAQAEICAKRANIMQVESQASMRFLWGRNRRGEFVRPAISRAGESELNQRA